MQTSAGYREAWIRTQFMLQFLKELRREIEEDEVNEAEEQSI